MSKKRYLLMLDTDLHQWAREFGDQHERSISWVVNRAIKAARDKVESNNSVQLDKSEKPKVEVQRVPHNIEEQFELLWAAKGRKGSKKKANERFRALAKGASNETCEAFTKMLIDDMAKSSNELGFAEMHLTTYLNQERWDK